MMTREEFMRRPRMRLLPYLDNEPPEPNHVGQRGGRRNTHGGTLSERLVYWILMHILKIWMPIYDPFTFIDCGCGSGRICFIVSAVSTVARDCYGIDIDQERIDRAVRWRRRIVEYLQRLYNFSTHHFLPVFWVGDFTTLHTPFYRHAIANRRVIFFCNNYDGVWLEGRVQARLEDIIGQSLVGSIVISLDRMFVDNLFWHEEIYKTDIQRWDLSWTSESSQDRTISDFYVFKYTKCTVEAIAHRRHDLSKAKYVPFTF